MAVKINWYPIAIGIPEQGPFGMAYLRLSPPSILGPPNGPMGLRVSTSVQRTTEMTWVAVAGKLICATSTSLAVSGGGVTARRLSDVTCAKSCTANKKMKAEAA